MKKCCVIFLFILFGCIGKEIKLEKKISLKIENQSGRNVVSYKVYFTQFDIEKLTTITLSDTIFIAKKIKINSGDNFNFNFYNIFDGLVNIDAENIINFEFIFEDGARAIYQEKIWNGKTYPTLKIK